MLANALVLRARLVLVRGIDRVGCFEHLVWPSNDRCTALRSTWLAHKLASFTMYNRLESSLPSLACGPERLPGSRFVYTGY